MPHARAGRAAEPAERIERFPDTSAGVDLDAREITEPNLANIKQICRSTFSIFAVPQEPAELMISDVAAP